MLVPPSLKWSGEGFHKDVVSFRQKTTGRPIEHALKELDMSRNSINEVVEEILAPEDTQSLAAHLSPVSRSAVPVCRGNAAIPGHLDQCAMGQPTYIHT